MTDALLVFDFGTSYFKAGVIDAAGRIVALHRTPSPISTDAGRSEIAPDAVLESIRAACAALQPHLSSVAAISFASQANTFTLLDADDRPQMPLIVWNDPRGDAGLERHLQSFADAAFIEASGIPSLSRNFTLGRLAWLKHTGRLTADTRRVQWLPDRFIWCLTGQHTTEAGLAALTGLFDVPHWKWNDSACGFAGIDAALLPDVARAGELIGQIQPSIADELHLPRGCRVVAGCLDQYAGALGVGNNRPGLLSETTGTVLATVACSTQWRSPSPAVFRGPAGDEGVYFHMNFGDVSANLLEHYRNQLPDRPGFESLTPSTVDRLQLDPTQPLQQLKETITRWSPAEPRGDVVRAIHRVVAAALASQVNTVATTPPESIRSAGGAARSRPWLQLKADVLGFPVIAPATEEPTLLGAASLAAKALGWPSLSAIAQPPAGDRVVSPQVIPR